MASNKPNLFDRFRARRAKNRAAARATGESNAELEKKLILAVKRTRLFPSLAQLLRLPRLVRRTERVLLGIGAAVFVVSAVFLAAALISRSGALLPEVGGTYTEALVGQPNLVNPLWADLNTADRDLSTLIFSGLFAYDANLVPQPLLAERFEITDEGKTYTIFLRQNIFWHDDAPVTTADVAFTVRMAQHPAVGSPHAETFRGVTVEVVDANTVVFRLERSRAHFLHALTIGLLPEHLWANVPPERARLAEWNDKPVGAGPYRFQKLRKQKSGSVYSFTLERNPRHPTPPAIETVILRFFPDYATAANALATGSVDGLAFVPRALTSIIERRKNLTTYELDVSQLTIAFFNQKQNPILAEKSVRQALAYATSRDLLITDAFRGMAEKRFGPVPPGLPGVTPDLTPYEFDMARAATLLEEEGWKFAEGASVRTFHPKDKKDKRFVKDTELKFTLTTVNVPEYVRAAELIRDGWRSIGAAVELTVVDPHAAPREVLAERKFDILLYGVLLGADPDPYPFWHSSQIASPGANLAQYANRRVDGLLEEARGLLDETARGERYTEFQKIVTAELPAIFLLSPRYTYAVDQGVHGVTIKRLASPEHRLAGIANWFVKTKRKFW